MGKDPDLDRHQNGQSDLNQDTDRHSKQCRSTPLIKTKDVIALEIGPTTEQEKQTKQKFFTTGSSSLLQRWVIKNGYLPLLDVRRVLLVALLISV